MRISSALLCDAATVREGLLHILGGGITRLWRPELPAPLNVALAVVAEVEQEHFGKLIEFGALISGPEDDRVAEARGAIQPATGRFEPGEVQLLPITLPLTGGAAPRYGRHSVRFTLAGQPQDTSLTFWVLHPEEQMLPPIS